MSALQIIEILGYLASFAVLVSMLMSSVIKLRIINFIGCMLFVIYGLIIGAYPISIANGIIAVIQIFFLYKMLKSKTNFRVVKCRTDDLFIQDFINVHLNDIKKFHPKFVIENVSMGSECYFCMVNEELAGIWLIQIKGQCLHVLLEYVKEKFRDCSMGKYIYYQYVPKFKQKDITELLVEDTKGIHAEYLKKIGFENVSGTDDYKFYIK